MIFSDFLFILGNTIYKHKFFIYEVNIMYGHTVEKSQLKAYNYNTLYTIGGIKMDRITKSMLDAFQNDFSLSFNDSALLF